MGPRAEGHGGTAADRRKRLSAEKAFAEGERLRARGDADSDRLAVGKYEQAVALWEALGEGGAGGRALRAVGHIYTRLGEMDRALGYFTRSLALCQASGVPGCEAAAHNDLSEAHLLLGDKDKSWEHCQAALRLSLAAGDRVGEAQALNNIGEVYYSRGDRERALEQYRKALPLWQALGDVRGEAQTLLYLGYSYSDLSDTRSAAESYERALSLWRSLGDARGQALTLTAVGHLHNNNGEGQQALDNYDRATPLFRRAGDRLGEARVLNGIGYLYNELGERRRAVEYHARARRLFREIGYKSGEAATLLSAGKVHYSMGDYPAALGLYQESLSVVRALADERVESYLLGDIGMVYASQGDTVRALDYCRQALALNRKLKDRNRESYTLSNIAYLQERVGERPAALATYHEALALSRATGDRPGQSLILYHLARVSRELGRLDDARARVEEALAISDALRTKVAGQEMRALYVATVHQLYEFYVDVLMRLHSARGADGFAALAFEASERGRARSLLETLAEGRENIRQGADASLVERERGLQRQLSAVAERRLQLAAGEASPQEVAAVEKELDALAAEYQQVQGLIRASSPRYAGLVQPSPLTLKEIQRKVLDADTVLLEYTLGDERSFVWAVTPDSIKSFELPRRAEVERAARRVYELLTARNRRAAGETWQQERERLRLADEEYAGAAATLSRMILAPVAAELARKRIVVVTDGALHYVPFAALPAPRDSAPGAATAGSSASEPPPLVVGHEVVLLPSASVLALMREELRGRQPAPKKIAVLADPVFDKSDARLASAGAAEPRRRAVAPRPAGKSGGDAGPSALRGFDGLSGGVARLPFSRREAEAIMALVPPGDGLLASGFRASRATATSPELSQYRYVHLATHGILNSETPELSGVLLSLFDEAGRRQDGFLQLHEVYNLNLPADLVVLSACQTALGKDVRGEGLVGLTRGFMYAGAARVVASLWKVDDGATAELMGEFYRAMFSEGMRPAEALRAAQVRMWEQTRWRSPYYWAAFTLQGEWR
ncbi:MAG TPA: CHAT domain-containing protein [Pyrinomonadaceae bacterium]|nr:CHAT domain-containing protein [Pyrinomonadaceae bacterium]